MHSLKPVRFLVTAVLLYVVWFVTYDLWLEPEDILDKPVVENLVNSSSFILQSIGFDVNVSSRTVSIGPATGVWIGDPCNGIELMALFAGFIIAFPGKWLHKLWFIPAGLLFIHLVNILRVSGLILIQYYAPETLQFNHTYTFTILVYIFIFILWMIWVRKMSNSTDSESNSFSTSPA